ncbi:DUF5959 family protein [Streptomyces sp. NBC_01237]|uniref:DUF5959 family protein n=1 Tax=Streptomyces sp. NBC_01237 TaxID=2903790 RepID=UPI002DD91718|nr:DUF5959 family protein [Streptomyces sp. NBC_01237]WRZ78550.1 DUF5959 family protein [Streptomyces sp. NBC_01237]
MGDVAPRELIALADDEGNSVTVSVLGRDPRWSAGLDAEIVVRTPFVSGRIHLVLSASKLDSWAGALNRLDAGEDVVWMEWDRGPSISLQLTGERDCPEVVIEDESGSMVTVRVPLVPPDDWIADHRQRLNQVMNHWVPMLSAPDPRSWRRSRPERRAGIH